MSDFTSIFVGSSLNFRRSTPIVSEEKPYDQVRNAIAACNLVGRFPAAKSGFP